MKNKLKNKKRIITKIFIAISSIFSIVGVGLAILPNHYKSARAVSYDDTSTTIILNANELNNFQFNNLHTYLDTITDSDLELTQIEYLDDTLDFVFTGEGYPFSYSGADYTIHLLDSNNKFVLGEGALFTTSINFVLNETTYSYVKQALEQDIQANQQPHDMGTEVIAGIVSGLGLIGDLASEFLTGFTTLFWANNQLTHFAIFSLCMLGIAISFTVVKLIMALIRSNTGV